MNTPKQKFDLTVLLAAEAADTLTPEQMGFLVDQFKLAEAERLVADKAAEAKKVLETKIKLTLIGQLKTQKTSAIGGKTFKVEYTTEDQPTVKDWPKFYAHILKTKNWDLLERRVGKVAVKLRWEDGKEVPGVDRFPVDKLSFTKLKG